MVARWRWSVCPAYFVVCWAAVYFTSYPTHPSNKPFFLQEAFLAALISSGFRMPGSTRNVLVSIAEEVRALRLDGKKGVHVCVGG